MKNSIIEFFILKEKKTSNINFLFSFLAFENWTVGDERPAEEAPRENTNCQKEEEERKTASANDIDDDDEQHLERAQHSVTKNHAEREPVRREITSTNPVIPQPSSVDVGAQRRKVIPSQTNSHWWQTLFELKKQLLAKTFLIVSLASEIPTTATTTTTTTDSSSSFHRRTEIRFCLKKTALTFYIDPYSPFAIC